VADELRIPLPVKCACGNTGAKEVRCARCNGHMAVCYHCGGVVYPPPQYRPRDWCDCWDGGIKP